jgi:anti-sigma-K factor RskA
VSGDGTAWLGFAVLAVAALALELAARHDPDRATAPQALAAAMRTTRGRVAVLAGWLWLGVHFLAR